MIIGIAAVDNNWAIGKDGKLLYRLKNDMKFFKEKTTGNVVLMGRNTWESIGSKPLKNRINMILTSGIIDCDDVTVLCNLTTAITVCKLLSKLGIDIYIIGGGKLYNAMLPYYDRLYITKVDAESNADTYFPNLDTMKEFVVIQSSNKQYENKLGYQFITYERKK